MKRAILAFVFVLCVSACGHHEGIVQKAEKSFLKFTGKTDSVSVQIDDGVPLSLVPSHGPGGTLYQLSPGKHKVKVYRDGILVVNRILVLDNQAIMEVIVP